MGVLGACDQLSISATNGGELVFSSSCRTLRPAHLKKLRRDGLGLVASNRSTNARGKVYSAVVREALCGLKELLLRARRRRRRGHHGREGFDRKISALQLAHIGRSVVDAPSDQTPEP